MKLLCDDMNENWRIFMELEDIYVNIFILVNKLSKMSVYCLVL